MNLMERVIELWKNDDIQSYGGRTASGGGEDEGAGLMLQPDLVRREKGEEAKSSMKICMLQLSTCSGSDGGLGINS